MNKELETFLTQTLVQDEHVIDNSIDTDAFLTHHGIKGMRWGVRRPRGEDGTVGGSGKIKSSARSGSNTTHKISGFLKNRREKKHEKQVREFEEAQLKALTATAKAQARGAGIFGGHSVSRMTDEDLRSAINRMQMEKQYKELKHPTPPPKAPKKESAIKQIVGASVKSAATTQLTRALNAKMGVPISQIEGAALVKANVKSKAGWIDAYIDENSKGRNAVDWVNPETGNKYSGSGKSAVREVLRKKAEYKYEATGQPAKITGFGKKK